MLKEKPRPTLGGINTLIFLVVALPATLIAMALAFHHTIPLLGMALLFLAAFFAFCFAGVFRVEPNRAVALTLFGDYKGTTRSKGLRWANPFLSKHRISLRVRNFETATLKVNELGGSPIEIAAVVVWQVTDSAEALFSVDDYEHFVHTQSESALRQTATRHAYDDADTEGLSLRSHSDEISKRLQADIQERMEKAGVEILEARISHLAYASEIASAMLQRQQASAVIAARTRIVDGAVGMVELALEKLEKGGMVRLDEDRKAAMVSNLLVVLCADRNPSPVINTGSLY